MQSHSSGQKTRMTVAETTLMQSIIRDILVRILLEHYHPYLWSDARDVRFLDHIRIPKDLFSQ